MSCVQQTQHIFRDFVFCYDQFAQCPQRLAQIGKFAVCGVYGRPFANDSLFSIASFLFFLYVTNQLIRSSTFACEVDISAMKTWDLANITSSASHTLGVRFEVMSCYVRRKTFWSGAAGAVCSLKNGEAWLWAEGILSVQEGCEANFASCLYNHLVPA